MTRNRSLLRRCLALLSAALLVAAWAVGISVPANAAPVKGSLEITSVTNTDHPEFGLLVQGQRFAVQVRVLDTAGRPTTVSQATSIVLEEASGPGALGGTTTAVIPRNGSSATISGATYGPFANAVKLRVRAVSGVELAEDEVTVDVAATAVSDNATPRNSFSLADSNCAAPTSDLPTCGQLLLPNGANGRVTMSVGSCDGLGACRTTGDTQALVVTAIANLKDAGGVPLYNNNSPATLVVACDKTLCREVANGVPKIPLLYTFDNDGPLTEQAEPCPAKGVLGDLQKACVDYVSSRRSQGDLYLHLLYDVDVRSSFP
jgi:hypothetical protein